MTNQEMIDEMIELQRAYDKAVYKEFNCEYDEEKCTLALLDEIGEFNHELKANWCYWKKTQKPIDREKALEELADVWHFTLSLVYHDFDEIYKHHEEFAKEIIKIDFKNIKIMLTEHKTLSEWYFDLTDIFSNKIEVLIIIGIKCGFSLEEVYEAYKKKNKTNLERLENGY